MPACGYPILPAVPRFPHGMGFRLRRRQVHGWDGCGVSRALDYGRCLAELHKVSPKMIAECAFAENAEVAKAQRNRNMKAAGLH